MSPVLKYQDPATLAWFPVAAGPPGPTGPTGPSGPAGGAADLPPETDAAGNTTYGANALTLAGATDSVAIGMHALAAVTQGNGTAVGVHALGQVPSAYESTAVGSQAGMTATGVGLTLIGHGSGYYPVGLGAASCFTGVGAFSCPTVPGAGNYAAAVGYQAAANDYATAVGSKAEARGYQSTAIGFSAIATANNQIMLGSPAERVFVNNDPVSPLEVATKQYVDSKAGSGESGGLNPLGPWNPTTAYVPDDLVTSAGSSWLAMLPSTGVDPGADASSTPVGSWTAVSPIALGSLPYSVAANFMVEQAVTVVALNSAGSFQGTPAAERVGIASNPNVPGVGVEWIGSGVPDATGKVMLDNPASLHPGVEYWYTIVNPVTANIAIEDGSQVVSANMAWGGKFNYGTGVPTTDMGLYVLPCILYGTGADTPWTLFVSKGDPGPQSDLIAPLTITSIGPQLTLADPLTVQPTTFNVAPAGGLAISGMVGIGKTPVYEALEVAGSATFSGNFFANNAFVNKVATPASGDLTIAAGGIVTVTSAVTVAAGLNAADLGANTVAAYVSMSVKGQPINPWVPLTQAEYDALAVKDPDILYVVTDAAAV